jgi:hypothetical protein
MQGKVRGLEDGPYADGEGLPALVALVKTHAGGFALHLADARAVAVAAMRTGRTLWPQVRFDIGESAFFGLELGGVENGFGHGSSPMARTLH